MSEIKELTLSQMLAEPTAKIEIMPLGGTVPIELSYRLAERLIAVPTRKGKLPSQTDVLGFIAVCRAQRLNPFTGDAYLVGYDTNDGPVFSTIVSVQAMRIRAERSGQFDGLESGVLVRTKSGDVVERPGAMTYDAETLLGAWARGYRRDQSRPCYVAVKLATYNARRSRWNADPEGMILKVAEAACLRRMFPAELGGLYTAEEMERRQPDEPRITKPTPTLREKVLAATGEAGNVIEPPLQQDGDELDRELITDDPPLEAADMDEPMDAEQLAEDAADELFGAGEDDAGR